MDHFRHRVIRTAFFMISIVIGGSSNPAFAQETELQDFITGKINTFSSKGHPKAAGLDLSFKVPSGWTPSDGNREHVVVNFHNSDASAYCNLLIINTGQELSRAEAAETFTTNGLREIAPPGTTVIQTQPTTLDGLPGGRIIYSLNQNRAGVDVSVLMAEYVTVYSRWLTTLTCGRGTVGGQPTSRKEFADYLPVFTKIANSIVIHNQWVIQKPRRNR